MSAGGLSLAVEPAFRSVPPYTQTLGPEVAGFCASVGFAPDPEQSHYKVAWPEGKTEEIIGRQGVLEILDDERRLARATAVSEEPIRQIMRTVRQVLDHQTQVLAPIKPRVLFSALGEAHAQQLAIGAAPRH